MRIQKVTSRFKNDFYAIYVCEHCTSTIESSGYEDYNFHANVIPNMACEKCNKKKGGEK